MNMAKALFCLLLFFVGLISLAPIVQSNTPSQVITITQTILSTKPSCVATQTGVGFTAVISFCGTTVNTEVTISQTQISSASQLTIIVLAVAVISFGIGYTVSKKSRK